MYTRCIQQNNSLVMFWSGSGEFTAYTQTRRVYWFRRENRRFTHSYRYIYSGSEFKIPNAIRELWEDKIKMRDD